MNPFENLSNTGLEEAKDVLGGQFGAIPSGVYTGTIKAAYAGKSQGGAQSLNIVLAISVNGAPREYRETVYVTSKKGDNFYEKDGKKNPLPGYVTANDMALLSTGDGLDKQEFEERLLNVYNFDQKKEVPTKVAMAINMMGKQVTVGILCQTVNKNVKNAMGDYVPSDETREENVIDKVFHTESGRTVSEFTSRSEEAKFQTLWAEKNTGVTRNKVKDAVVSGKPGVPGTAGAPNTNKPSTNLFGAPA